MGCRSDYMEPTKHEIYCQKTAKLYVYVLGRLGRKIKENIIKMSTYIYANVDYTKGLCETLGNLHVDDPAAFDELVYNAKDKESRKLADWWEEHQAVDRQHIKAEQAEAARKELVKAAIGKLTPEEIKALGIKS